MRVIALNKHRVSSNFTACLRARKKTERFFASNSKCIVYFNKILCWKSFLLIFVSLSKLFIYAFEKQQTRNQGHICISGLKFDTPKVVISMP